MHRLQHAQKSSTVNFHWWVERRVVEYPKSLRDTRNDPLIADALGENPPSLNFRLPMQIICIRSARMNYIFAVSSYLSCQSCRSPAAVIILQSQNLLWKQNRRPCLVHLLWNATWLHLCMCVCLCMCVYAYTDTWMSRSRALQDEDWQRGCQPSNTWRRP